MPVYLFRHGKTLPAAVVARVLGVDKVLEKPGLKPDDPVEPIAEILRQASSGSPSASLGASDARLDMREASRVLPAGRQDAPDALRDALRPRPTQNAPQTILIAGHLPFIPKLASLLKPDLGTVELKSGGAIKVSL